MKPGMSDSKASEFLLDLVGDTQGSESVRCRAIPFLGWKEPQKLSGPLADRILNLIVHYKFKSCFGNQHRFVNLPFFFFLAKSKHYKNHLLSLSFHGGKKGNFSTKKHNLA